MNGENKKVQMNLLNDPFVVGDRFHNHLSGRIFNIWFMIPKFALDMI